jgi:hypothetical protein
VGSSNRQFVITDGREKIYLVALADRPQPHLHPVAEGNVGPYTMKSATYVVGDMAMVVGEGGRLLRFRLPSLESAGELPLPGDVVWGPFPVGDSLVLATANRQMLALSAAGEIVWQTPLEQNDLAGRPALANGSEFVLAYRDGVIERRALADGKTLGAKDLEHPIATGPVRFMQRLVLAAHDGTLLVVDQP